MSFVEWGTALALLVVALGGGYAGVIAVISREVELPPYRVKGRGAFLLALLYFAGEAIALVALLLLFLSKSS
jgi:hypothetical protein